MREKWSKTMSKLTCLMRPQNLETVEPNDQQNKQTSNRVTSTTRHGDVATALVKASEER